MKVVAIPVARMGSTRLPGKVMRDLGGVPVLQWTLNALRFSIGIDAVVLATTSLPEDDVIADYCKTHGIQFFRGNEEDVLDRVYQAAKWHGAELVVRATCDCPFLDPHVVGEVIRLREMTNADYATNADPPTWPDGLDVECFTFKALEEAHRDAVRSTDRNSYTQYLVRNRNLFKVANLTCPLPGLHNERWVLDTESDYKFCSAIAKRVIGTFTSHLDILRILEAEPELRKLNPGARNERFYQEISQEGEQHRTFERSQRIFERARQTIPFAAQTFSKSHLQFPRDAPLYVSHGDGAYIFDVDGNDYVDLVSAVLPVILGYRDPDVDEAIRRQLDNGISFSLATELEYQLSELLCKHIPCAEMVKLGKNGSDVTTAAVRLARAYTGRDHIVLGGYHGWADWSMSVTDRALGIPEDVRQLSHRLKLNECDIIVFDKPIKLATEIAAFIVEPGDDADHLQHLREFCTAHGIVLIFDEIITGFRYGMGGAQELHGVTPDLATFGKAMANGMPISALVGRRDIMKRCEPPDNIFYSGTFFGETLSIAAAIATINKLERENVIDFLLKTGMKLEYEVIRLLQRYQLNEEIKITGWYPLLKMEFHTTERADKDKVRSLWMREMIRNGVLIIASNNLSFAHKSPEIQRIVTAYDKAFATIAEAIHDNTIESVVPTAAAPVRVQQ